MRSKKLIFTCVFLLAVAALVVFLDIKAIGRMCYPFKYSQYVYEYSQKYDLNPYTVAAVIKVESNFNSRAKSSKNAYGLMQITDKTGEWAAEKMEIKNFNVDMLYSPEFNINMGCWYLKELKKEFNGNMDLVFAAYNGGRGNVKKWLKDPQHSKDGRSLHYIPYKETDIYVKRVKTNYNIYKFLYEKN